MCPLSENARRTLNELSNSRDAVPYENQLKDSIRQVSQCVGDLHERLRTRRDRLNDLRRRREEKGTEKSAEEERLEVHIPKLEKEVADLTRDSEHTVRQIVDWRTELEDEGAVFVDLYQNVASSNAINPGDRRGQRGPGENDESGPENDESVTSVLATYRELRTQKKRDYTKMSPYERYALNNDYVGFKKIWYDAAAGDDGPPLPDPTRWFLQNGEPDLNTPGADEQGPTPDDDNDDDDVAVSRENISINCPLTLLPMTEPYANRKCPHRFEKSAILEYLPARGMMQCPQTGCSQVSPNPNPNPPICFFLDLVLMLYFPQKNRPFLARTLSVISTLTKICCAKYSVPRRPSGHRTTWRWTITMRRETNRSFSVPSAT